MKNEIIRKCERAHYFMQLSSYFSELSDLPGISFAYSRLVSDTWYNQAYNIHDLSSNDHILQRSCDYFGKHDRETCFYLTPATTPLYFAEFLKRNGFVEFDAEAWMFFDFSKVFKSEIGPKITIKEVTENDLELLGEVYCKTLPGPEVNEYVQCVKNGYLSHPPLVDIQYYIAFYDGHPVGMLSLLSFEKYSGLYAVAVDENYKNKGICKALVSTAVSVCKKRGTEYLFLQTGDGEDSQKAFEHMNFKTEFVRIGYVRESSINDIQHG